MSTFVHKKGSSINMQETEDSIIRRRNFLRAVLLFVIIGTLPFYCIGFFLWGNAPQQSGIDQTLTAPAATDSSGNNGGDASPTVSPSWTPLGLVTATGLPPLLSTPTQFFPQPQPPTFIFIPTATIFFPPPATAAPTLTPAPTNTQFIPPTNTSEPLPLPTLTATWTAIILPTDTDEPPPVEEPPAP